MRAIESERYTVMNMSLIQLDLISSALGVTAGEVLGDSSLSLKDVQRLGGAKVLEWAERRGVSETTLHGMAQFAARKGPGELAGSDADLDGLRNFVDEDPGNA